MEIEYDSACSTDFGRIYRSKSLPHDDLKKVIYRDYDDPKNADYNDKEYADLKKALYNNQVITHRRDKGHSDWDNSYSHSIKDSGIDESSGGFPILDGGGDSVGEYPSIPSSAGAFVQQDFPSAGSGMLASEPQSACTCDGNQPDQVKVVITKKGPVVLSPSGQKLKELRTLKQHYYPEGGWGWGIVITTLLVQIIVHGLQIALAMLFISFGKTQVISKKLEYVASSTSWLGALSTSISLLISPVTIAFCRSKSTRLTAVMGGLVTALGCLFTSFATQFHQLFFSYGIVIGVGVGMTRDTCTLMIGQYFKRKRELVEIFLVSGSGFGISVMSVLLKHMIRQKGWRLGLQAVTGLVFLTFILGMFYRSASLYHPQRRAILHLKNQKRKIKSKKDLDSKNRLQEDKLPFFDFSTLKSRTVQILLVSTSIGSFGLNTPIFYLVKQAECEALEEGRLLMLQTYLGLAWAIGCCVFGVLVVRQNTECHIARQYLCQTSLAVCGVSILAFTSVQGYSGYVIFVWVYGIFCGGYHYSLKMYVYEKVRARNFARAWGFVQCSQAIPNGLGIPVAGYINVSCDTRAGYYFSSTCVLLGSVTLFLIDIHKSRLRRKRVKRRQRRQKEAGGRDNLVEREGEGVGEAEQDTPPQERRNSFPDIDDDFLPPLALLTNQRSFTYGDLVDLKKPELTCISEEGIADMDIPDNLLDELDYLDNITSCNKVENYLMLSEYEQNLIKETESPGPARKGRKWSLVRQPTGTHGVSSPEPGERKRMASREMPVFRSAALRLLPGPKRSITTIDEASV